jgi:homoserine kinase type II
MGKWVSVFPWRAGVHLAPAEVTDAHAERLGAALARLHVAGLELPAGWRRGSIYDHDHLVGRYDRVATVSDPHLARAVALLGEELGAITDAAALRRRATSGMIHGDLFRDNVLWEQGEVSALLDFEQASGGSLAYDLAVCINDWCWDPVAAAPRCSLASALLAGYRSVRPLPDEDRAALALEIRAAAARFTITRITDVYLARVANPEKDFRAFLARVEAWRGPALGQLTASL